MGQRRSGAEDVDKTNCSRGTVTEMEITFTECTQNQI